MTPIWGRNAGCGVGSIRGSCQNVAGVPMNAPISREYKWGGLGVGWAISIFQVNFYFQFYLWFFFYLFFFPFLLGVCGAHCVRNLFSGMWLSSNPTPLFGMAPVTSLLGPTSAIFFCLGGYFFLSRQEEQKETWVSFNLFFHKVIPISEMDKGCA